jgi:aspartate aminotransferase
MVKLAGGTPVFVLAGQNEKFKMRPEELDAAITAQTKWLMFCSPSNPTGAAYARDELRALADVLLRHPHVHILTDDVYEHLLFDGREFATLAQVEPQLFDRTVTANSVSKAYSMTGFRCGYAGGPKDIIAKMSNMQSQSTAGVSAVGQAAAVAALNGPQELLAERSANLQHRRDILFEKLNAADGLSCDLPDGAMYIFCSCAGAIGKRAPDGGSIETDTDFTMYLLDAVGVAVVQGEAYGLSPYFRASFVAPEADLIRGGDLIQQACAALG